MIAGAGALLLAQAAAADSAPAPVDQNACRAARATGEAVARDRACIALAPDRVYEGLYLDAFESQRFFAGVESVSQLPATWDIWIDRRPDALVKVVRYPNGYMAPNTYRPRLYRVRFIGAEPAEGACRFGGRPLRLCYGHMGMSSRLVVADRFLSAVYVGDLPQVRTDSPR